MTRRSTFKHQMLGFYFNINGLRRREGSEPIEAEIQAAATIYVRAYEKLQQTLPSSPSWLKRDDVNPEITYSPFELCEESLDEAEIEGTDGLLGFSFWLFSYHQIETAEVMAFRQEVISAFNAAAVELGGQAQLIRVEARVTEEVTQTSVVDLEPNSR